MEPALGADGKPITVADRDAHRPHRRASLADERRPDCCCCSTRRRRQQPRGPRADHAAVRRRPARPHPPGAGAGRRRREGAGGAGHHARRVSPERRAQRVCRARGRSASGCKTRASTSTRRRRARGRADRLHHAYAGAGRPRPLSGASWSKSTSGRCATRSACRYDELMALGRVNPADSNEAVLHDGARAEAVAAGQRRVVAARARLAAHVGRSVRALREEEMPIGHITNGVHVPTRGSRRRCGSSTTATSAPTGRRGWASPRSGRPSTTSTRRVVGDASDAEDAADRFRPPARGSAGRSAAASRRRWSRSCADALDPDALTIGFARRFATYKRANLLLQDLETTACAGQPPAAAGAVRSSPARPIRRTSRARRCCSRLPNLTRDPRFCRQDRVHRGLRHQRRPPPGPGRRRLAEQPAAAARGLGHQRPEGGAQRRRSTCRCSTAGGPRRTTARTASRSAWARRHSSTETHDARDAASLCTRAARTRSCRSTTTATRRPAAGLDRADETRIRTLGWPLQRRPHGDGLRAEVLHPGRGRHEQRRESVLETQLPTIQRSKGSRSSNGMKVGTTQLVGTAFTPFFAGRYLGSWIVGCWALTSTL